MKTKATTGGTTRAGRLTATFVACALLLSASAPALAQKVCFPPHEGIPLAFAPPNVDGYVEPELGVVTTEPAEGGYKRSTRLTYAGDSIQPLMVFQAIKHSSQNFIYLSFDVRVDESFDDEDTIVLVFRPDFATGPSHNADERRIDISPVFVGTGAGNHPGSGGSCVGVTGSAQPDDSLPVPTGFPPSTNFHTRTNRCPKNVEYKKWNLATSQWDSIAAISNADIKVRSWDMGTTNKNWSVEVKLPTQKLGASGGGADWINLTNNFAFYYDVIRVCDGTVCSNVPGGGSGTETESFYTVQYPWPRTRVIQNPMAGPAVDLATFEIPPSWLGEAIMGPGSSCQGVKFMGGYSGIGVKTAAFPAALGTSINGALGATNVFAVRLLNDGPAAAPSVSARFRIANWGVIGDVNAPWDDLPAKPPSLTNTNPTNATSIPTGATPTDLTVSWTIDAADRLLFKPTGPRDPHQCIWVTLNSPLDVDFADSSIHNNFTFVGLSTYEEQAEINGKGLPPPDSGTNQEFLLRTYGIELTSLRTGGGDDKGPNVTPAAGGVQGGGGRRPIPDNVSDLEKIVYARQAAESTLVTTWVWGLIGYVRGTRELIINSKNFRIYNPVGSFGYGAEHSGPVQEFKATVTGPPTLKPVKGDGYHLPVPQDSVVPIKVRLEAVESNKPFVGGTNGKFAVFLHAGANFPHGTFGSVYDPGFSFNGGLEYAATNYFSVEGIFGYHRFSGQTFGAFSVADLNTFQFSGNGKFYLVPPGSVRPWVNFGIGAYKFESGPTRFGGNIGTGLQFNLKPKFALEGAYNLHAVASFFGSDTKFSTLQGGVRFRF
jgi:opacity protein-like surface antigen